MVHCVLQSLIYGHIHYLDPLCLSSRLSQTKSCDVELPVTMFWFAFYCWNKATTTKGDLGRKGSVWLIYSSCSASLRKAKVGTQPGQELGHRKQRSAAYWLSTLGLLHLLSYLLQNYWPRDDTTHSGLRPPTSNINQESAPTDLMEAFFYLRLLFPRWL